MKSLAIAATGMNAQQTNIEVIANNIANINTTSYKRARAEFTDLFYQMDRMQGVANVNGSSPIPEGANLGLGAKSAAIRKLHIQGALTQTGRQLCPLLGGNDARQGIEGNQALGTGFVAINGKGDADTAKQQVGLLTLAGKLIGCPR